MTFSLKVTIPEHFHYTMQILTHRHWKFNFYENYFRSYIFQVNWRTVTVIFLQEWCNYIYTKNHLKNFLQLIDETIKTSSEFHFVSKWSSRILIIYYLSSYNFCRKDFSQKASFQFSEFRCLLECISCTIIEFCGAVSWEEKGLVLVSYADMQKKRMPKTVTENVFSCEFLF